jgi:AbiJ N-terminal domain 4
LTLAAAKHFIAAIRAAIQSVYDLMEFILQKFPFHGDDKEILIERWNEIFRTEILAYRIVNDLVVPIQSDAESRAVQGALTSPVALARRGISRALKELSLRSNPDYNAVIREAIDALEGFCKQHSGNTASTLRRAIEDLADRRNVDGQLRQALLKLSDFVDAAGIRHPRPDAPPQTQRVAVFLLTLCSAFITFIDATN